MNISLYEWLIFTSVLVSAMVIPGPGVFATIAYSLSLGSKRAMAFVLGAAFGDLTFLWIALLGLGVFLQTASLILIIVLFLASLYFAHMSFKLFIAFRTTGRKTASGATNVSIESSVQKTFLAGYSITVSNPKVVIFYLAILPALLNVSDFGKIDYVIISILTPLCLVTVLGTYAYATGLAGKLLSSVTFTKAVNLTASIIFGMIALMLLFRMVTL